MRQIWFALSSPGFLDGFALILLVSAFLQARGLQGHLHDLWWPTDWKLPSHGSKPPDLLRAACTKYSVLAVFPQTTLSGHEAALISAHALLSAIESTSLVGHFSFLCCQLFRLVNKRFLRRLAGMCPIDSIQRHLFIPRLKPCLLAFPSTHRSSPLALPARPSTAVRSEKSFQAPNCRCSKYATPLNCSSRACQESPACQLFT